MNILNRPTDTVHADGENGYTLCGLALTFQNYTQREVGCLSCLAKLAKSSPKEKVEVDKSFIELVKKQHHIIGSILTDSQLDTRLECGRTIREYYKIFKTFMEKNKVKKDGYGRR